ncbi:MAG TPA: 3-deoxy-manno-octulosonate cytidylyltransferase [Syntrophobacteraceae bacterium]|nr:3-deoxy-manno-octulosonate cytidylyltransferase [Syntrophobacteraceae bacterium]
MSDIPKILGVIPARYDSTRLPGKVLRDIAGKPMLYWVYRNARKSRLLADLLVATDSERVLQFCEREGIPVMLTGRHPSGTDRLREVMERVDADIYINIQGDEPTLRPEHIEAIVSPFLTPDARVQVATLKVAVDEAAAQDPNNVKVVTDDRGRALYFSRCPIPFDRDGAGAVKRYKHIGIYAYTRAALTLFHSLTESSLESAEKLEQLRFLENGVAIYVVETPYDTVGVDTEADLERVRLLLSGAERG